MRPAFLCIVVAYVITGCVAIDRPARYSAEDLDRVEVGTTTREEVTLLMGMPKHTGQNGQIFFYRWELSRAVGMVPVPAPVVFVFGSVSFESVRVDFDSSGVVSKFTRGTETLSVPFEMNKYIGYTMAFPKEDEEAKRFVGDSDACTVYFYVNRVGGDYFTTVQPMYIKIDRQPVGNVGNNDWYYRQIISPGQHTVVILAGEPEKVARFYDYLVTAGLSGNPAVMDSLTFDCVAGELYFFEVRIGLLTRYPDLRQVDSDEGREAVNKGSLLIAPQ